MSSLPQPSVFSSSTFNFDPKLNASIASNLQFTTPTIVQERSFPHILKGSDLLIKSETGSGKSLAFLLPIINHIITSPSERNSGIVAIIISPTRELALQLQSVCNLLLRSFPGVVCGSITGGEKRKTEKARLRKGVHILVATPGRLRDHFDRTSVLSDRLENLKYLVLDEADQLLDFGFLPLVNFFLNSLSNLPHFKTIQRILVSATLSTRVVKLSESFLNTPALVNCDDALASSSTIENLEVNVPTTVSQYFSIAPLKLKFPHVVATLSNELQRLKGNAKVMVFVFSCVHVDFFHSLFTSISHSIDSSLNRVFHNCTYFALHGGLDMIERKKTIQKYLSLSGNGVLFCTDVAARGLDITNVDTVIQIDPPHTLEGYIHRTGRTGRIGNFGRSILLLSEEERLFLDFLSAQKLTLSELPLHTLLGSLASQLAVRPSARKDTKEDAVCRLIQILVEQQVASDSATTALGRESYQAFVSAYSSLPKDFRSYFDRRKLHLGHLCRFYGLKDQPSSISGLLKQNNPSENRTTKRFSTALSFSAPSAKRSRRE
ncbi:hypothetical protein RCL1_004083 [Eukaryota sp. TZLM3-RCL]